MALTFAAVALVGFLALRRAGRSILRALAGTALLLATAFFVFILLALAAKRWLGDYEPGVWLLPIALAALVWLALRNHAASAKSGRS